MTDDRQQIIDLAVAYTWALDTRNLDELRDIFTPDATGDLRNVKCNGVDEIIARIGGSVMRLDATQHLISNHQVVIDGDNATHRCHMQGQHTLHGTEGGDNFIVAGVYEDRMVRTADGWRIAHRTMRQLWADGNPAVIKR